MNSLAPQDATRYWLSRRACNDLLLLYSFTDAGYSSERLRAEVIARAASVPDLCLRLREHRFAYPDWVRCDVDAGQITEHVLPENTWPNVVAALAGLLPHGVLARERAWRLHVFRGVRGAPGGEGPALVAVLQVSHALADGKRAAAIARALWSDRDAPAVPASRSRRFDPRTYASGPLEAAALAGMPIRLARTVIRGFAAERDRRALADLTVSGEIPAPATDFPPTRLNRPPAPIAHAVRMIVREDLRAPGRTVTVVALTAIARALSRYLGEHGEPDVRLGAQVSMALPVDEARPQRLAALRPQPRPRNNYFDAGIELLTDEPDPRRRADRIAATLEARRVRARHPLMAARNRVTEVIPAALLRRDIAGYPLDLVPEALSGHTVVSSVYRGPADLVFGGGAVRWTGGFPALGAVMHLTHGIHGLGDTVTVSVHADTAVVPDIDVYAGLLDTALTETVVALRS